MDVLREVTITTSQQIPGALVHATVTLDHEVALSIRNAPCFAGLSIVMSSETARHMAAKLAQASMEADLRRAKESAPTIAAHEGRGKG